MNSAKILVETLNRADGGDDIVMVHTAISDGCRSWEWKMKDFELAVSELLDQYRNKIPRKQAADALLVQYNLTGADDSWKEEVSTGPSGTVEEEPPAAA